MSLASRWVVFAVARGRAVASSTAMSNPPIIVVGAGIVGVSTAIWLRRFGKEVLLLDRAAPGEGASFGNAGLIAQWAVTPVTTPGLWKDIPKFLGKPSSPLFIEWGYLPRMLPWLMRYLSYATDRKTLQIVDDLHPLLHDAVDQHKALAQGTSLDRWVRDSKLSYVYKDEAAFRQDAYSWALKARCGFEPTLVTGGAVQEEEPILGSHAQCLAVLEGQGHITDPGGYVKALAQLFEDEGGRFVQATVQDIVKADGRVSHVETDQGRFDCSEVVVTAGIWSKDLMTKLGLKVQLEAERGYHVLFEDPSILPRNPMMMTRGKFAVNPMALGLRCAGTVELGSHKTGPRQAPIDFIKKSAAEAFPTLRYSGTKNWMGFRPSTPDSLPMIGQIGATGIYTGFGHQHIGLTAGPKTGRILAQMLSAQTPNAPLGAYDPMRFLR